MVLLVWCAAKPLLDETRCRLVPKPSHAGPAGRSPCAGLTTPVSALH